ncbi:hypothetical protein QO010_002675 [Caulobacter ginsengisoli]|jgi:hypothetical protein|uniref:Uncharacterized protein n=1 Tax=Caulobacter ginsengisoli TaxID=400775 RepID=A0ABU0IS97_9CAUL|nr:hypothetical protein [Caulobacter ginsengisoli]MDQ0464891.1 hypothetical protein [Caulobacter ginsengisoli]
MRFWPKTDAAKDHHHTAPTPAEVRAAYDRGRRDERARHRRSPLLALTVGSAALVGGAVLALAALEGSFQNGGAVVDQQVSKAAQQAGEALRDATDGSAQSGQASVGAGG